MLGMHDNRHRIPAEVLLVDVRATSSGHKGVFVEVELDEADWDPEWKGFSVAVGELAYSSSDETKPEISVSIDVAHFDEDTLQRSFKSLSQRFSVRVSRLYQFAELPPAKIVIEFTALTLQTIPANLIASFLWESIKSWFLPSRGGEPTVVVLAKTTSTGRVEARIETSEEETLREAMQTVRELLLSTDDNCGFDFDEDATEWHRY